MLLMCGHQGNPQALLDNYPSYRQTERVSSALFCQASSLTEERDALWPVCAFTHRDVWNVVTAYVIVIAYAGFNSLHYLLLYSFFEYARINAVLSCRLIRYLTV